MHIAEIDWRYSWTRHALVALEEGLDAIFRKHDDGLDMLEDAVGLIGLGLVAIQGYIRGTAADLERVFPGCPAFAVLVAQESTFVDGAGLTQMESTWAAANYFKHHDEWTDWNKDVRSGTLVPLTKLGVTDRTDFPCVRMLERIEGEEWNLPGLLDRARQWRGSWFARLKALSPPSP